MSRRAGRGAPSEGSSASPPARGDPAETTRPDDPGPVDCRRAREGLTDYLEGALAPARRRAFDEHLASCPACRRTLDETRATIRAAAALPDEPMPPAMKESLLRAFRTRPPS